MECMDQFVERESSERGAVDSVTSESVVATEMTLSVTYDESIEEAVDEPKMRDAS
jgi:hypothetical protein